MKRKANNVRGKIKVGDIVQIPLANVNVFKSDNKNLTLALVEFKLHSKEPPSQKLSHEIFQMD